MARETQEVLTEPEAQTFRQRYGLRGGKLFGLTLVFVILAIVCVARKMSEFEKFIFLYLFSVDLVAISIKNFFLVAEVFFIVLRNGVYAVHLEQQQP